MTPLDIVFCIRRRGVLEQPSDFIIGSKRIMRLPRAGSTIGAFALALLLCGAAAAPGPSWHHQWGNSLFAEAAQSHRLVLLDLKAVWCHWCHVMEETTYQDQRVKGLLARHFVIVSVDADSDPELAARYGNWGWPATIVLAADGSEIVKRRGYIPAAQFASLLQAIVDDPTAGPSVDTPVALQRHPPTKLGTAQKHALEKAFDGLYDDRNGGWGTVHKYLDAPSIELSFLRVDDADGVAAGRVRQTLDANLNLLDPIWGGVYQYSDAVDWHSPHFEKLLSFQADDLRLYSEAYARWGDPRYLAAAHSLYAYLTTYLQAPDGGFYVSQDADVSSTVSGHEFYAKDAAGRRAIGMPRIDWHEYTRETGWAIRALCRYYDVTGDRNALAAAERAAGWVHAHRARSEGGYRHDSVDRRGPFLDDSLAMAQAYLSLYQSTARRQWLTEATGSLDFVERTLRHAEAGYSAAPAAAAAPGVFGKAFRTPGENAALVEIASLGYDYTGQPRYRSMARHGMRYLSAYAKTESQLFHPEILLADREAGGLPIHITVVGAKSDPAAQALHAAALRYPSDFLQIDWWDRAEGALPNPDVQYPQLERAAAFACTSSACSMPIYEPSDISIAVKRTLDNSSLTQLQ